MLLFVYFLLQLCYSSRVNCVSEKCHNLYCSCIRRCLVINSYTVVRRCSVAIEKSSEAGSAVLIYSATGVLAQGRNIYYNNCKSP